MSPTTTTEARSSAFFRPMPKPPRRSRWQRDPAHRHRHFTRRTAHVGRDRLRRGDGALDATQQAPRHGTTVDASVRSPVDSLDCWLFGDRWRRFKFVRRSPEKRDLHRAPTADGLARRFLRGCDHLGVAFGRAWHSCRCDVATDGCWARLGRSDGVRKRSGRTIQYRIAVDAPLRPSDD